MCMRAGKVENVSYFIGPLNNGYRAEVKIGTVEEDEEFKQFSDAVAWVEKIQKKEFKKIEDERHKEDT